jgi:predicted dehydrogenase
MRKMNVGIIGYQFMGKAHSNAWIKAPLFFDLKIKPELKVACGRNKEAVTAFAEKWGWQEVETDWKKVVENPDIDIIDISLPQHLHYEVAMAAAKNGKHIFCEKPLAHSRKQAEEMLKAAEDNGVLHYLNHNYRRIPAVKLAKQLIEEGKIGRVFHWRGAYQQDWIIDPDFPLTWQLKKETAHAGPHWDLNSHSVDLAHYLVGDIKTVSCLTTNFITERPLPTQGETAFSSGTANTEMGKVTVEDTALMMVEFENGAVGSFEATRFATGRKMLTLLRFMAAKAALHSILNR